MRIENDSGLSDLLASEETRRCYGFTFTEGPVWIVTDGCLLFSDIPGNRVHRWRPGWSEAEVYRDPSGHANGLTLDHAGNVLACEHSGRRVSIGAYNAPAETLVDGFEGARFNSPNDLVVHSSGAVYFTDPTYGERADMGSVTGRELDFQGVYRLATLGTLTQLSAAFTQPNGLCFSPDETVLYIGDSANRTIRRFNVDEVGLIDGGELFVDMRGDDRRGAPDGMKVDEDGRLWTTGAGGVWVIDPDGVVLGQFEMAEHAANIAFGGPDFSTLYLTAQTSVYSIETRVRGIGPGSR
ncbi:MAG TPA: SMP-30/gluconolactonase/LRE family protein [Thermomicrobiales bacterium]|nr:SMP-30/gluconolactonase/LRE family protein [Thermomicrobiales bacterium]